MDVKMQLEHEEECPVTGTPGITHQQTPDKEFPPVPFCSPTARMPATFSRLKLYFLKEGVLNALLLAFLVIRLGGLQRKKQEGEDTFLT